MLIIFCILSHCVNLFFVVIMQIVEKKHDGLLLLNIDDIQFQ